MLLDEFINQPMDKEEVSEPYQFNAFLTTKELGTN